MKPVSGIQLNDKDASVQAKGALHYLVKHQKRRKILKFLPDAEKAEFLENLRDADSWDTQHASMRFGLADVRLPNQYLGNNYYEYIADNNTISVRGYDRISSTNQYIHFMGEFAPEETYVFGQYSVLSKGNTISVKDKSGKELTEFDLVAWLKKQPLSKQKNTIDLHPYVELFTDKETKIDLYITRARYTPDGDDDSLQYLILAKGLDIDE